MAAKAGWLNALRAHLRVKPSVSLISPTKSAKHADALSATMMQVPLVLQLSVVFRLATMAFSDDDRLLGMIGERQFGRD
jgi:hypothetical protein